MALSVGGVAGGLLSTIFVLFEMWRAASFEGDNARVLRFSVGRCGRLELCTGLGAFVSTSPNKSLRKSSSACVLTGYSMQISMVPFCKKNFTHFCFRHCHNWSFREVIAYTLVLHLLSSLVFFTFPFCYEGQSIHDCRVV